MDKFLASIGLDPKKIADQVWAYMEPKLTELITDVIDQTMEQWGPKIGKLIDDNLDAQMAKWMPRIIKAVIIGTTQAVRGIAVDSEDKLTDLIPGQLDDAVLDPMVKGISDIMGKIGL